MTKSRHIHGAAKLLLLLAGALVGIAGTGASASEGAETSSRMVPPELNDTLDGNRTEVLVFGTAHLAGWRELERDWIDPINQRLIGWEPDMVLIERLPGWQFELFRSQPERFGNLLGRTHGSWIAFSKEAQDFLGVTPFEAENEARMLLGSITLTPTLRLRLALLELANYETEAASLHWSRLPDALKEDIHLVPQGIATHLTQTLAAKNETTWMAMPIAAKLNHDRIYAFDDQIEKAALNNEEVLSRMDEAGYLDEFFSDPAIARLNDASRERPSSEAGAIDWFKFLNSEAFARLDIEGQWVSFLRTPSEGLGRHRVALWEARNLRMVANAREQIAKRPGGKVLIIVGSAHRPWMEAYLRLLSDVTVVSFEAIDSTD